MAEPIRRRMTGERLHVVFQPTLTLQKGDVFRIMSQYNDKTSLYDYFFFPPKSDKGYLVRSTTYDKLLAQSVPV